MPKKNKNKNKHNQNQNQNPLIENEHDRETEIVIQSIENTANQIRDKLINDHLTKQVSSLRAVNGHNNQNIKNKQSHIQSREVGQGLQTQCVACRRRLFDSA